MKYGHKMYGYVTVKYVSDGYYKHPIYYKIGFRFRIDPVPGLMCWRGQGKYYKHPHSTQEMRMYYAQDSFYTRGKRKPINLPTVYDDCCRNLDRNWKRTKRKNQWRQTV